MYSSDAHKCPSKSPVPYVTATFGAVERFRRFGLGLHPLHKSGSLVSKHFELDGFQRDSCPLSASVALNAASLRTRKFTENFKTADFVLHLLSDPFGGFPSAANAENSGKTCA